MRRMVMVLGALAIAAAACASPPEGLEVDQAWWSWVNQQWPEIDGQTVDPGDPAGPPNGMLWIEGDSLSTHYPVSDPVTPWPDRVNVANQNFSIGGSSLDWIYGRLQFHLPTLGSPDHLVIMAGINDIVLQGNSLNTMISEVEQIETLMGEVPVTWVTITPMTYPSAGRNSWNNWLRANRTVIDCGDTLGSVLAPPYALGDRVHLNAVGQQALADCIGPQLPTPSQAP